MSLPPRRRRPGAYPPCDPTSLSSTPAYPTARASTCAGRSDRWTPTIKGLILTSYDDEHALTTAVLAGASAFVLKDVRGNGLVDTIRRVAAGENLLDTAQAHELVETWRVHGDADPRLRVLTPQERRILEHIAAGLTNREIGEEMALAEKTVKNLRDLGSCEAGHESSHAGGRLRCHARIRRGAGPSNLTGP